MRTKPEFFNFLIREFGLTNYLEIGLGVGHLAKETWRDVVCENKIGVDSHHSYRNQTNEGIFCYSSDEFFQRNERKFDSIFIGNG